MAGEQSATNGDLVVPPTIQALLAARIELLRTDERAVLERAAVEGRVFHRGAVAELLPASTRTRVGSSLMVLIRKELIRPDRALFAGDDAFRFAHVLIRDAAYDAMPKQLRSELHERFARWLERVAGARAPEFEEFLGYHLEQAYRYGEQLGPVDERCRELGEAAAEWLAGAGRKAWARGDIAATVNLLSRAASLLPRDDPTRHDVQLDLGLALEEQGEFARAEAELEEVISGSIAAGRPVAEARARAQLASVWMAHGGKGQTSVDEAAEALERTVSVLTEHADDLGLARAGAPSA